MKNKSLNFSKISLSSNIDASIELMRLLVLIIIYYLTEALRLHPLMIRNKK